MSSPIFPSLQSLIIKINKGENIDFLVIRSNNDLYTILIENTNEQFFDWLRTANACFDDPPLQQDMRAEKLSFHKISLRQYVDAVRILQLMPQATPLPKLPKSKIDKSHLDLYPIKRDCLQVASRLSAIYILTKLSLEPEEVVMEFQNKLNEKRIPKASNQFRIDDPKRLMLDGVEFYKFMDGINEDIINKPRIYSTVHQAFVKENDDKGVEAVLKIQDANGIFLSLKAVHTPLSGSGPEKNIVPADSTAPFEDASLGSSSSSSSSKHSVTTKRIEELKEAKSKEEEGANKLWSQRLKETTESHIAGQSVIANSLTRGMVEMAQIFVAGPGRDTALQPRPDVDPFSRENTKLLRKNMAALFENVNLDVILKDAEVPDNYFEDIGQKINKAILVDFFCRSKGDVTNFSQYLRESNVPFVSHGLLFNYLESKAEFF